MMIRCIIAICLASACVGNAILDGLEKQIAPRIIGGSDANIEDYSYTLSVMYFGTHLCGATIIGESWALTAAGCLANFEGPMARYEIRAGSSTSNTGGMVHNISSIVRHPRYKKDPYDYDFALAHVEPPFVLGIRVSIIPLPVQGQITSVGFLAEVTGWGYNASSSTVSLKQLQVVTLPVIEQSECQGFFAFPVITDRMICTGVAEVGGGVGTCIRDEGGPMVVEGQLVGVVTYGNWTCGKGRATIYSRVSSVRFWIDTNTNSAGNSGISFFVILSALLCSLPNSR